MCRDYGIADATYYNWKAKYGGMEVSDVKRLKELEEENRRFKQMIAPQAECETGSYELQTEDLDADDLIQSAGESKSYTFTNCLKNNQIYNGQLSYQILNQDAQITQVQLNYQRLMLTDASQADNQSQLSGSKTLSLDTTNGLKVTTQVNSNALTAETQTTDSQVQNTQFPGYQQTYQTQGNEWQLSFNGTNEFTLINGDSQQQALIEFNQTLPLKGTIDLTTHHYSAPYEGDYSLIWNDRQSILIQATSGDQIQIDFDNEQDGTIDATFTRDWHPLTIPE